MKKIVFSMRRALAVTAVGVLGLLLNLGGIFYFLDKNPNFTHMQLACVAAGIIAVSSGIQYVLINVVNK